MVKIKDKAAKKEIAVIKKNNIPVSTFQSADFLLTQLANKSVDVGKLEKLLEIKGKYEAEENKKLFQRKFAELQSELPIIEKTKQVRTQSGQLLYSYASLEKIIEQIKPVLKKFGFSYRWSEGLIEKDGIKRIYCHIMACGYTEKSFMDIPIMSATKTTNQAQQAGSSSTYGKRYSLIGALGIMADEDNDGQTAAPEIKNTPAPKITKKDAIVRVINKYKELCKFTNPAEALKVFISQVQTKELNEIIGASQKLDQLIKKYKK